MKIIRFITLFFLLMFSGPGLYAEIAVGITPFKGDKNMTIPMENKIKEYFVKSGGISVIADSLLKEILEVQEKASSLGSAYHDISKLKTAEYLVAGSVDNDRLNLTAVDVNRGIEIFNKGIPLNSGEVNFEITRVLRDLRDSILVDASSKSREVSDEVAPYMQLLNSLVSNLHLEGKVCYKYLVFYHNGKYTSPKHENKEMANKADLFLKVIRPNLVRSKLRYIFMKANPPWIYVNVIADKLGKKTKHKFGIIELDDGSIAVGIYEPME